MVICHFVLVSIKMVDGKPTISLPDAFSVARHESYHSKFNILEIDASWLKACLGVSLV